LIVEFAARVSLSRTKLDAVFETKDEFQNRIPKNETNGRRKDASKKMLRKKMHFLCPFACGCNFGGVSVINS